MKPFSVMNFRHQNLASDYRSQNASPYRLLLKLLSVILLAWYPILALLAANLGEVEVSDSFRSFLISTALAITIFFIMKFIFGDWVLASLITSTTLLFIFSYGHLYGVVEGISIGSLVIGRHRFLLPFLAAILFLSILLVSKNKQKISSLAETLSIISLILVIWPLLQIGNYLISDPPTQSGSMNNQNSKHQSNGEINRYPDVYYIVLDGFGRPDILADFYDTDLNWLQQELTESGFYIADQASTNYSMTTLSLASSLNMEYLNDIVQEMDDRSKDHRPLVQLIGDSKVENFFRDLGYELVTFETGYLRTTLKDSDLYLAPEFNFNGSDGTLMTGFRINEFEGLLLGSTIFRVPMDLLAARLSKSNSQLVSPLYQKHGNRVLFTFDELSEISKMEGPQFVFAHIISPHPPFVFGAQGQRLAQSQPFTMQDNGCCQRENYIEGYRGQAQFVSKLLVDAVQEILSRDENQPIIIIQGDHGPAAYWSSEDDNKNVIERMTIMNAYYLPLDQPDDILYESITPVNSFRVVLSQLFGLDLELLPDRNFYSIGGYPYNLEDVTEIVSDY